MLSTRSARSLFFVILAVAVAQCIHDFPLLPERLASHFGASGMPNGWMTRTQFFLVYGLALLPALAIEFWAPGRIAAMPSFRINLPNKEYWLAPERRSETFAYFEKFFAWFGCAVLLVEVVAMGLAMRANFTTPPRLPMLPIVYALAGFLLYCAIAVILMQRRFGRLE